jgi:hypothetical protein
MGKDIRPSQMVVKLFSATKAMEREHLGETVTEWLAGQPDHLVVDEIRTMQSSDQAFHCVTMIVFAHLSDDRWVSLDKTRVPGNGKETSR